MKKSNKKICNVFLGSDIYILTIDFDTKKGYYTLGRLNKIDIKENKVRIIMLEDGVESVYDMKKNDFFNGGNSVTYESEFFCENKKTSDYLFATRSELSYFCNTMDIHFDGPERNNNDTVFIRGNRFLGDEIQKYFLSMGCDEYFSAGTANNMLNYWDDNLLFYNVGRGGSIECCQDGSKVHELLKSVCRELTVCDILDEMEIDKNADYNKKLPEAKPEFSIGTKVIVRNKKYNKIWMPSRFQKMEVNNGHEVFIMMNEQSYPECVELNKETIHLIGTSEDM